MLNSILGLVVIVLLSANLFLDIAELGKDTSVKIKMVRARIINICIIMLLEGILIVKGIVFKDAFYLNAIVFGLQCFQLTIAICKLKLVNEKKNVIEELEGINHLDEDIVV